MVFTQRPCGHTFAFWQRALALVESLLVQTRSLRSGRCRKHLPLCGYSMEESDFFARCKSLVGDTSPRVWDRDSMAGFFQCFRDRPARLKPLFDDIDRGDAVYNRLVQVFNATKGHTRDGRSDLYCVVRQPDPADSADLLVTAKKLSENYRAMAAAIGEQELVDLLSPIPDVRLVFSSAPDVDPNDYDSVDVFIYDVVCDWHGSLSSVTECARWMSEAFYYINCDYSLGWYTNWDWFSRDSAIDDPFLPYFKLWQSGAELRYQTPDDVTLYLPPAADAA